mgnify:CR=1 FL=1
MMLVVGVAAALAAVAAAGLLVAASLPQQERSCSVSKSRVWGGLLLPAIDRFD